MKKKLMNWKICLKVLFSLVLLFYLYKLNFPLYFIILLGVITISMIILKGKIYLQLDKLLNNKFKFISKLRPWTKKLIIIVFFILVLVLLKQVIFLILKIFGIDVQSMILKNVNQSI